MKTISRVVILFVSVIFASGIHAQEVSPKLDEALSAYNEGSLDDARFALEQALVEIDIAIGKLILEELPKELNSMHYQPDEDDVTGTSSNFAGLFVNRFYGDTSENAEIQIISDSPLLAGVNAILAMPAILTGADPNQKRIKVDGYKALLQKNEEGNGAITYDIQIPFEKSLLSFSCRGVENENEVIEMVNLIPVGKIVKIAR
jgi:hypothetical protein